MGIVRQDSPRIDTSRLPLGVDLKPHQRALLHEMLQIEKRVFANPSFHFALMSDKPGAGKTYAVLALIFIANRIIFYNRARPAVNLIVVPYNIFTQWKQSMDIIFRDTDIRYKSFIEYADITKLFTDQDILKENDILLTTSLYYDTIANTLRSNRIVLDRVIFDEADTIKGLLQTEINARMVWFVSASIESVFDTKTKRARLGSYDIDLGRLLQHDCKCDPTFVDANIRIPDPKEQTIRCESVYIDDFLLNIVEPRYREALLACDYRGLNIAASGKDALCDYTICLEYVKERQADAASLQEQIVQTKKELERLIMPDDPRRQVVSNRLRDLQTRLSLTQGILNKFKLFIGRNRLCERCLNAEHAAETPCTFENPATTKVEYLKDILESLPADAKCIVFSNHDGCYKHLRSFMTSRGIYFGDLDGGNIKDMDHILYAYKKGNMKVLLTDSSMFSCGMNLENTTDIIFIHKMEALKETQVIGRAQRYGRTGVLRIWRLGYKSEIG